MTQTLWRWAGRLVLGLNGIGAEKINKVTIDTQSDLIRTNNKCGEMVLNWEV